MPVWHEWLLCTFVDLLDDMNVLFLEATSVVINAHIGALRTKKGPGIRKKGNWRPSKDLSGVWHLVFLSDVERLSALRLRMTTPWTFTSRTELKRFFRHALQLQSRNTLRDWIVFGGVVFHSMPPRGSEWFLAHGTVRITMCHAVYEADVYLRDLTPKESEPTVTLQLSLREVCDPDEVAVSFDIEVLCLHDCSFSYTDNPMLDDAVWNHVSDYKHPLPLMFAASFY